MQQTAWVIKVLEDSNRRSIEYENKSWLYYNGDEMHIQVKIEDCNVTLEELKESFEQKGTIVIQDGKKVKSKSDFNSRKEALLIRNVAFGRNYVFQYFPQRKK